MRYLLLLLTLFAFPRAVLAQEPARGALEMTFGPVGMPEAERIAAGARILWLAAPRLSAGAEVQLWFRESEVRNQVFAGFVAVDLAPSSWRAVPYVAGSAGWVHTSLRLRSFTDPMGAATAGVRIRIVHRFHLSPEFRVGYPLHAQVAVAGGFRF